MGLISDVMPVFDFLALTYAALPKAIQMLILATFGGVIYISVLRSIWR